MATHSSVLAWRIPGTGEPGGLPSLGSHRVRHNWSDLAAAAAADCRTPGLPAHHQLLEFAQTHVHWVGDAIQPSHPLSSPSPPFNLSQHQGLFQWVSSHQVVKDLEFQLQHQSFQSIFRADSFRMGWLDLLAVQGTLESLLQLHSSKAPVLQPSAFFIVQLSHPYMTTGETIVLNRWTSVGKGMSLLLNMLSGLAITFIQGENFFFFFNSCSFWKLFTGGLKPNTEDCPHRTTNSKEYIA